jgi:hypothetical protein
VGTVDNIEVAQFIYLLLHEENSRAWSSQVGTVDNIEVAQFIYLLLHEENTAGQLL